jgi:hypothetical protein
MTMIRFCRWCGTAEDVHDTLSPGCDFQPDDESVVVPLRRGTHTPRGTRATVPPPRREPPDLAHEQDILGEFLAAIHRCGVVGEDATAATSYLAMTSRVLEDPVSLVVKGASSSGKSHTVQTTARFFPCDAVIEFTGMSERALVFAPQDFRHRSIIVYEAVALRERAERESGNLTAYFVRSLISEGRISYPMSVRTKEGEWTTKIYTKEGPTNVIVTTTATHLHNENETRLLSLQTNDTPEQTRRVLLSLAEQERAEPDLRPWQELQAWLQTAEHRVAIPYARWLAENVPPVAVRLRRDFRSVLSLIRAHAVLHQASRERDADGRIVASEADYAAVRELILPVVSQGVGATVSHVVRETVGAVEALAGEHRDGVPAAAIARLLQLDKSAARRRLLQAAEAGFVVNLEDRRGRPGRYVLGEPLPEDLEILPALPPHHRDDHPTADVPAGQEAGDGGGGTVARGTEGVYRP